MSCLPIGFCQNGTGVPAVLAHLVRSGGALPLFPLPYSPGGEQIDFPKETQAKHLSQGLPLGRDSFGYPVALDVDLLKKHAFVCGVPGAGQDQHHAGLVLQFVEGVPHPLSGLRAGQKGVPRPGPDRH